eukprot:CAMPEP_0170611796 /NCGR_PEP_ID=MMETSP0224-20130122/23382_1 /TAXON_ID=285029 /ORGANISM="Togula jolla, Strain CCCM 725" /LENGTH=58 /DNA_ID=CAMNT_0010937259 /DNA_START=762 /DNA_END=935 /DNA_ORIENTATION=-
MCKGAIITADTLPRSVEFAQSGLREFLPPSAPIADATRAGASPTHAAAWHGTSVRQVD